MDQKQETSNFLCIDLLKSFSKKELQKFNQFINSPYFNTDLKLIRLFEVIRNKVLNTEFNDQLQSEVYQFVFEKTNNSTLDKDGKKTLRAKLSKLNQLAHQFLVIENLTGNQNYFNDQLYKCLLNKNQLNSFLLIFKRDKKRLESKTKKDSKDFEHLYKIETHFLEYLFLSGKLYNYKENNIIEILYNLDVFYLYNKLSHYIESIVFQHNSSLQYSLNKKLFYAIRPLLDLPEFKDEANIVVLKNSVTFLENPSISAYNSYFSLLQRKHYEIPTNNLRGFYQLLQNFLAKEIKKGNTIFDKELIKLYFSMDERSLIIEEGLISPIKLKNIVTRLNKSKNFTKAEYFTNKYSSKVRLEERESTYNYCLASIAFYKKDYKNAMVYLFNVKSTNVTLETNHRLLMMKIYYELDKHYSEKTERYYRSAEKLFADNKILSVENKKSYRNFTQILINLYRLKHNEGRMTIEKLKQKLEAQDYNIDRKWLLQKLVEMKLESKR